MPLPSQIKIDRFLTGVLIGLDDPEFIADQVLPPIYSNSLTGKVAKMDESHLRVDFPSRAKGAPGQLVDWGATSVDFSLDEFRLEHPIDDVQDLPNYESPFDAYRDGARVLEGKLNRKKELLVATLLMTSTNYPASHRDTNNKSWDVPATGKPVTDVGAAIGAIQDDTGAAEVNLYGVCSSKVFRWLRLNDQVRLTYLNTVAGAANPTQLTRAQVASALGLRDLYVGSSIHVTSKEGAASATKAYIWGADDFAVFYKTPNPGIISANFGYQIFPTIPGLPGARVAVDRYREESKTSEMIRARLLLDQIVGEQYYGYIFTSVDAS